MTKNGSSQNQRKAPKVKVVQCCVQVFPALLRNAYKDASSNRQVKPQNESLFKFAQMFRQIKNPAHRVIVSTCRNNEIDATHSPVTFSFAFFRRTLKAAR